MREFFQKLNPLYTLPSIASKGELWVIRERMLHTLLLVIAVLMPFLTAALYKEHGPNSPYLPVVLVAFLVTLALLIRGLPYAVRGYVLIAFLYFFGIAELLQTGRLGDVRLYLLTFIAISSVLFSYREAITATLLSIGTTISASIYAANNTQIVNPVMNAIRAETDWFTNLFFFLIISICIAGAITLIIDGLSTNLKKQSELVQSIEDERDALEDRIHERTRSMARRMVQLRTASDISRTISALRDPEEMLQQVVDLIRERFDLYYVGIFLLDSSQQNAVLKAGTGEAGRRMMAIGHHLVVGGSSMIGWSVANRKPRIALDVGADAVRFNNPNLPLTHSELALPIMAHEEVLGALTIQSEKQNAFDESDITILESIADSLAIALDNDRLFHETRQTLEELRALNRDYLQRAWTETVMSYGELAFEYENPLTTGTSHPAHTVQVPLMLRDEKIGEITLEVDQPALTAEDNTFVENITTQTAIALENARLLHETERRAVQEQKLNELASRFSRALSIDEILRAAAQELGQLPAVIDVSVQLNPVSNAPVRPTQPPASPRGNGNGKEHTA